MLSDIVLAGVLLNSLFGWSWADPVAALRVTVMLVREGLEAWREDEITERAHAAIAVEMDHVSATHR